MSNKIANLIFEKSGVPKLEKYLNLASLKHKLTSGNIANSSTPGYRSRSINFQEEYSKLTNDKSRLSGAITDNNHIPLGQHKNSPAKINQVKVQEGDLNSVDIDHEIADMAQNELLFSIGARLLQQKFQGIKKAITSK